MNRLLVTLLLLGACAAACAGPGGFGSRRTVVRLYDGKTGVRLELADEGHPELRDVYSQERAEASLKLAPAELMSELLDRLDELNFDDLSAPGVPPQDAGVLGWISVEEDGATRSLVVRLKSSTAAELRSFASMQLVFSESYAHGGALQYIENPQGADLFRRQPAAGGRP